MSYSHFGEATRVHVSVNSRFIPISRGLGRACVIARNRSLPTFSMPKTEQRRRELLEPFQHIEPEICGL